MNIIQRKLREAIENHRTALECLRDGNTGGVKDRRKAFAKYNSVRARLMRLCRAVREVLYG